ncbi:TetR/AcrR family transcriptional regulator [Lacticaseibacillus porcinae]|uniref:TetR/AcrR family transcriptional regulator n=1 Tax=Lacticaseibacillus porcinae TaxID=1123687 RepID=UPI000F76BC82|nr:TetR/AcrR family transcriptional regulator [Lacticaseibacillus porcinae]
MARKKSITDIQILDMAYQIVIESGFKVFTARNIARHLNCSTQPIYLEFNSMGELKKAVMMRLRKELKIALGQRYTADPLVDIGLAFADFVVTQPVLYDAVFVKANFGVDAVRDFLNQQADLILSDYQPAATLTDHQREDLIKGLWIVGTGVGSLAASGFVQLTDNQRSEMMLAVLQDFIANGRFTNAPSAIALDQAAVM